MTKAIKKALAFLLCCVMLLALAACNNNNGSNDSNTAEPSDNGGSPASTPTGDDTTPVSTKDTLTVAVSGDNGTLVPAKVMGGFAGIVRQYMEGLMDYTYDGTTVWLLATGIEEVSTSQWTVHLREGVTFSNGNKFDAYDVWFSLEYYLSDPTVMHYVHCFDLENSKIIDDYTIDLALSSYEKTQMGALCQVYMLDAESFDEDTMATNPVGTGPYVVTEYVINSHLYMEANDNYWGEKAKIKNLHFRSLSEDSQLVNAIQTGLVDVSSVPSQEKEYVESLPGYNVESYYTGLAPTISFNFAESSLMSNLDARLAVCYAADRQSMIDISYSGNADLLAYPASMHCLDYEDRLANLHPTYSVGRDLDLARQHAEAAGLVGQDIVVITNGAAVYATEAEILQANLAEIGVNVVINNYDAGSYWSIQNDPTMFDIALYAVASPQMYASGMLTAYVDWGGIHYAQTWDEYDDFMALGKATLANPDTASYSDMLYEMSQIFVEVVPWYGICDVKASLAIHEDLGGVQFWVSGGLRYAEWYWMS